MPIIQRVFRAGLLAGGLLAATCAAARAEPSAAAPSGRLASCFYFIDWEGWSSPSPDVIYMRVRMHDVYRVDLSAGSSMLQSANVHLINRVRGPDTVCNAIDLDLAVADDTGMRVPLIAKSITKLTEAEIAALPKKYRP